MTRLCQTIASATGRPVARSQTIVGLALVGDPDRRRSRSAPPAAAIDLAGGPRAGSPRSPRDRARRRPAPGSAARTPAGRARRPARPVERRSPATRSCPGRGRGSSSARLRPATAAGSGTSYSRARRRGSASTSAAPGGPRPSRARRPRSAATRGAIAAPRSGSSWASRIRRARTSSSDSASSSAGGPDDLGLEVVAAVDRAARAGRARGRGATTSAASRPVAGDEPTRPRPGRDPCSAASRAGQRRRAPAGRRAPTRRQLGGPRRSRRRRARRADERGVDGLLGHQPVRRVLAAADPDEAVRARPTTRCSRDALTVEPPAAGAIERPQPGVRADDVGRAPGRRRAPR